MDFDGHMPAASRPHVLCSAENMAIDSARVTQASCPKFRPGYLCGGRTYHHYAKGAFSLACAMPDLQLADYPKDHLQDIISSMQQVPSKQLWQVCSALSSIAKGV